MFNFFNLLAFKITRENWGFPWHILLALVLAALSGIPLLKYTDLQHAVAFSWIIVNVVGIGNEIYEKFTGKNPKKDFWQDVFANNLGWLIGVLILCLIALLKF